MDHEHELGKQLVNLLTVRQAHMDFDLFVPLPNSGQHRHNLLREINIIAAHNAYHTGELGILRQVMGLWS